MLFIFPNASRNDHRGYFKRSIQSTSTPVLFHGLVMLDYCHEKVQNKVQNTVGIVEFEIESVTKGLVMIA